MKVPLYRADRYRQLSNNLGNKGTAKGILSQGGQIPADEYSEKDPERERKMVLWEMQEKTIFPTSQFCLGLSVSLLV